MDPVFQESALVVLVPEAEALVGSFRLRYDPSARVGVPAHITVLYPFVPPDQIDPILEKSLRALFLSCTAFDFELAEIREFPDVLFLAPAPDALFQQLIKAVCARFPIYPPYGGAFPDPIPHLTIGQTSDPDEFDRLRRTFARAARGRLPIPGRAAGVALLENRTGTWQRRIVCSLGG